MPESGFTDLLIVVAIAFGAPLVLGLAPKLRLPAVVLEIIAHHRRPVGARLGRDQRAGRNPRHRGSRIPAVPRRSRDRPRATARTGAAADGDRVRRVRRDRARRGVPAVGLALAPAILAAIMLVGCGGAGESAAPPAPATDTAAAGATTAPAPTPKKLGPTPRDVPGLDAADAALIAGYLGWTELTQPPIAELQGLGSAHGGQKRVWASPQREALIDHGTKRFPYPDGTVIVKQGTQGDAVTLIALMEKTGAGGAGTGGWRYAEYTRPTADAAFTKVGLPQSGCAGCHMNANTRQQTDWVFWSVR